MIGSFRNEYAFLSNMYPCRVLYDGIMYSNAEAAFQAQKCVDEKQKEAFAKLSGIEARKMGRTMPMRSDWNSVRVGIMGAVIHAKFFQNHELAQKLVNIDGDIAENNTWGDTFWGICNGRGENMLGRILMNTRDFLEAQCEDYYVRVSSYKENFADIGIVTSISRTIRSDYNGKIATENQWIELAPSQKLFSQYLNWKNNGFWNEETFNTKYVPQYISEIASNPKARGRLNQIYLEQNTVSRTLLCHCENELLCHRSIVAGILMGTGIKVQNFDTSLMPERMVQYYEMYKAERKRNP